MSITFEAISGASTSEDGVGLRHAPPGNCECDRCIHLHLSSINKPVRVTFKPQRPSQVQFGSGAYATGAVIMAAKTEKLDPVWEDLDR